MKVRKLALAACAAAASLGLSATTVSAAPPPTSDGRQQVINSRGSNLTLGLMQRLGTIYNASEGCNQAFSPDNYGLWANCASMSFQAGVIETENYDHDAVVEFGLGNSTVNLGDSGQGRRALWSQGNKYDLNNNGVVAPDEFLYKAVPTEIARSSRVELPGDCSGGLTFHGFARDTLIPISWRAQAGSPAVGVTSLTKAQLQGIFRDCTITNWGQVGGSSAPIEVWGRQLASDDYKTFNEYIEANVITFPNGANSCVTPGDPDGAGPLVDRRIPDHNAAPILALDTDRNSIWYMSYGPWNTDLNLRGGSSRLKVNGIDASGTTITNGTYPLGRFLYLVTDNTPPPGREAEHNAAKGFVDWVCKNSSLHSTALGKQYATLISQSYSAEGFFRNPDNAGGAGTTCVNLTT